MGSFLIIDNLPEFIEKCSILKENYERLKSSRDIDPADEDFYKPVSESLTDRKNTNMLFFRK